MILINLPGNGKYKVYNKRNAFENRDVHVCAPGKLYVSSVIKDRYFPKGRINEDEYHTYKCVFESDGIAVMSDGLYYYFQQPDSIMHKKKAYLNIDILDAFDGKNRNIFAADRKKDWRLYRKRKNASEKHYSMQEQKVASMKKRRENI